MGGCIAHGMLSATLATRIFSHWLGDRGCVTNSFTKFSSPVKPGDCLTLAATVSRVTRTGDHVEAEWDYTMCNASGTTVLAGTMSGILESSINTKETPQ